MLPRVGHNPPRETPQAVADAVIVTLRAIKA
jgi:hypothetical protein